MITGIMITRGMDRDDSAWNKRDRGVYANMMVSPYPDIRMGVTAGLKKASDLSQAAKGSKIKGSFVLAISVHKLSLQRPHKNIAINPYTRGNKFSGVGEG